MFEALSIRVDAGVIFGSCVFAMVLDEIFAFSDELLQLFHPR